MNRIAYAAVVLSLVACRGGGGNGGDDTPDPDGPPIGGDVTIQEVQSDSMPSGTAIELNGVVVTAIDGFGDRTGDFFVSEPGGGPFSGVKVFGAAIDQVGALVPGDIVNITGAVKHEACNEASPCGTVVFDNGASITEVFGASQGSLLVVKVGSGPLPPPAMVDAKAIAALPTAQERDAEWEKYEGVLVTVTGARQTSSVDTFGSNPGEDSNEFRITSFARVQSVLVELPGTAVVGTCYESITGVTDFFFNYIVAPRSAADLVGGGTDCNPLAESVNAVQTATTIPELVTLTEVVVTAIDAIDNAAMTSKGIWVQDAAAGAANNGVFVFLRDQAIPAFVTIGARINIIGSVDEFDLGTPEVGDKVTEIVNPIVTDGALADVTPTPAIVTAAVAGDIGTAGEAFEGVLVRINQVKVTNINAGAGKVELTDSTGIIIMDNESFNFPAQVLNTCYNLTGVMHVQVNDDVRTINPRSVLDMAVTTGCIP